MTRLEASTIFHSTCLDAMTVLRSGMRLDASDAERAMSHVLGKQIIMRGLKRFDAEDSAKEFAGLSEPLRQAFVILYHACTDEKGNPIAALEVDHVLGEAGWEYPPRQGDLFE